MQRRTVTHKYAQSLHGDIRKRDDQIGRLQRDIQHAHDDLSVAQARAVALQRELDAMAAKVNKMGTDLGAANMREMVAREVARTALNGMAIIAGGIPGGTIGSTLLALERDGRAQLKLAGNGAHA
jgi:chromosome segregation ATPase